MMRHGGKGDGENIPDARRLPAANAKKRRADKSATYNGCVMQRF